MPGKERHDADDTAIHNQRVACKRHHPFPPRPVLIAHFGSPMTALVRCGLRSCAMRPILNCPERDLSMRAVHMRVEAGARLQLEHAFAFVEGPDSGKGGPQMGDERLGALLQGAGKRVGYGPATGQRRAPSADSCALKQISLAVRWRSVMSAICRLDSDASSSAILWRSCANSDASCSTALPGASTSTPVSVALRALLQTPKVDPRPHDHLYFDDSVQISQRLQFGGGVGDRLVK